MWSDYYFTHFTLGPKNFWRSKKWGFFKITLFHLSRLRWFRYIICISTRSIKWTQNHVCISTGSKVINVFPKNDGLSHFLGVLGYKSAGVGWGLKSKIPIVTFVLYQKTISGSIKRTFHLKNSQTSSILNLFLVWQKNFEKILSVGHISRSILFLSNLNHIYMMKTDIGYHLVSKRGLLVIYSRT